MTIVTVKVRNKDRLLAALRKKVPKVQKAIEDANFKSAKEMADMMRRLVPVDDGDLRDSITVTGAGRTSPGGEVVADGAARISTTDFKARWVEFGTVNAKAQPFFFPSYRANRKRAKGRVTRAINKAIKQQG